MTTITYRPNTGGRLHLEWARLRTQRCALRRANSWPIVETPITDLDDVLALIGYEQAPCPVADERLLELILIARTDELAARVIVQRVLPGLLAVVRRRRGIGQDDVFDELLGAMWVAIRTFTPSRRPSSPAAALISDADYRAFRMAQRRRSSDEVPVDTTAIDPAATPTRSADDELNELFADARAAGFAAADLQFLRDLMSGPTAIEIAAALSVTPRTLRNRRDKLAVRLRELALAA
jgi:DNA-directed RNA polymerase specialized sigma24 family protein